MTSPLEAYLACQSRRYGSIRRQLMHVYVQKSPAPPFPSTPPGWTEGYTKRGWHQRSFGEFHGIPSSGVGSRGLEQRGLGRDTVVRFGHISRCLDGHLRITRAGARGSNNDDVEDDDGNSIWPQMCSCLGVILTSLSIRKVEAGGFVTRPGNYSRRPGQASRRTHSLHRGRSALHTWRP